MIVQLTKQAVKEIKSKRLYQTERGFQGELVSKLNNLLTQKNVISNDTIIEEEYQKRIPRHNLRQRPDIIIHIPTEDSGSESVRDNNFVVYALKLEANKNTALIDFNNLDDMFKKLEYPIGIFINIGGYPNSFLTYYAGEYKNRIHELSISLKDSGEVQISHSYFKGGELTTEEE